MKIYALLLLGIIGLAGSCATKITPKADPTPTLAPSPSVTAKASPLPLRRKHLVAIDAGHGGDDFGTEAPSKPMLKEKSLNLATARMLELFLQQMGYLTTMTRQDDQFVSLVNRAKMANEKHADLFVSLHYNSAPNPKAEGIEVFYFRSEEHQSRSNASKELGQKILNRLIKNTEAKSRGVKHGNLSVIRHTQMASVLVEGGFMTSEKELTNLRDGNYIKKIAWSIAQGIQDYLNQSDRAVAGTNY